MSYKYDDATNKVINMLDEVLSKNDFDEKTFTVLSGLRRRMMDEGVDRKRMEALSNSNLPIDYERRITFRDGQWWMKYVDINDDQDNWMLISDDNYGTMIDSDRFYRAFVKQRLYECQKEIRKKREENDKRNREQENSL